MFERIKYFLQNNKRLLLLIAGILIIIFIIIFSIPRAPKKQSAPEASIPGKELVQPAPAVPMEPTPEQKSESSALAISSSFAEIYGSYSNQSNYANIETVLPLVSSQYRQELSLVLSNFRASYKPGAAYEGTTTVVVNKIIEAFNEAAGTATVLLQTQRKLSQGTQSNYTIKYQNIRVDLVKEGDSWFVDNAKWIQ